MESLTVPAQANARHPQALIEPKRLRAWLSELPVLVDPCTSAKSLLRQLQLLVRYPDPVAKYGVLVGMMRNTIDKTLEQWLALLEASDTKQRAQRNFEDLKPVMQQLLGEAAFAEKRLVKRHLEQDLNEELAEDVHAAMRALGLKILMALLSYQPVPMSNWREMLSLYDIGTRYGLARQAVAETKTGGGRTHTIEQCLFAGLLIQLADPYRLPATEIWHLYQRLVSKVHLIRILPLTQCEQGVRVDLNGRVSPLANVRDPNALRGGRQLCLDLVPLTTSLGGIDSQLLNIDAWHHPERASPRTARTGIYVLYRGLQAIHHALSNDQGPPADLGDDTFAHRRLECRIRDHSSGGAALTSHDAKRDELRVGDLLICQTRSVTQSNRWVHFVAEIRRLLATRQDSVNLGVQKITGRLLPARIESSVSNMLHRDALLRLGEEHHVPELFTASGLCTVGARVRIRTKRHEFEAKVTALRVHNPNYDWAQVQLFERRSRPPEAGI